MPGIAGVMKTVVDRSLDARRDNTGKHFLRCGPVVTTEQPKRQIDDRQRAAANDPASFLRDLISSDKMQ